MCLIVSRRISEHSSYENYSYGMNWAIEMRPSGFKAPFTIKQLASTAKRTDDVFDFEIQQEDFDKPQKKW